MPHLDDGLDLMVSCTTAVFTPGRTPLPTTPPRPFEDNIDTITPLSYGEDSAPAPAPTPTPVRQNINKRPCNLPYGADRPSAERETDKENTMAEVTHIQNLLKGSIDILDQAGRRQTSGSASTVSGSSEVEHQLRKEISNLTSERDDLKAAAAAGRAELFKAQKALGDAMNLLGNISQGHTSRSSAPPPPLRMSQRSHSHQAMSTSSDKLRSVSPPPRIPFASIPKKDITIRKPRVALTRLDANIANNNFNGRPKSVFLTAKSSARRPFVHHDPSTNSNESVIVGSNHAHPFKTGGKKPTIAPTASKGRRTGRKTASRDIHNVPHIRSSSYNLRPRGFLF